MKKVLCFCLCALMVLALPLSVSAMPEVADVGKATIVPNDDSLQISSENRNTVIQWSTFDVDYHETVIFDNGEKANSYLNLVNSPRPTYINGTIKGGADIYIVNPNGVIVGGDAEIDVGSLHVSTRPFEECRIGEFQQQGLTPLPGTAENLAGDIINLGEVNAFSASFEGKKVYLTNSVSNGGSIGVVTVNSERYDLRPAAGSVISNGVLWMIHGIAAAAVVTVIGIAVVKKKKSAAADSRDA